MRIVPDQAGKDWERRYRRLVRRAQLGGLLADHLALGEPYLATSALVLSADEAEQLGRLVAAFSRAFAVAGRAVYQDVPRLVEWGFPWAAAELLAAEPPQQPLVGRFDFLRDERGHWWLLELNADTPSGVREAAAVEPLVWALLADPGLEPASSPLGPALAQAFRQRLAGLPGGSRLGLMTTAGELEDLAQMAFTQRLLATALAADGLEVVLGDADNLAVGRLGARLCGLPIQALYRYVPFEAMLGTPPFAALYEAVLAGQLRLLNGLYGLLLQHKALLAWLYEHRADPRLDPEAARAVAEHLPPTWLIQQAPAGLEPADCVVKQVFGREGEEVSFGDELAPAAWRELWRRRTYVVQRRVAARSLEALVPTSGGPSLLRGAPTVGAFAVDGRPAGYYTRFGGRIITVRSKWLATLVERRAGSL